MRRATIHCLFALVSAALLLITAWQGYQLLEHRKLLAAVEAVPASIADAATITQDSDRSVVLLAQANGLSRGGQFEAAETIFVKLSDRHQFQPTGQAARFNLANQYLREGMRQDLPGAQTRPLLEIAKQRYRDLLRADPADWDARHNLERALRVAPEAPEKNATSGPPPKSVRVIVPDFQVGDLP